MAWRAKHDLQSEWYFNKSYDAELLYMRNLLMLIQTVNKKLMKNEFAENQDIFEYLNLSFKMADEYYNNEWSDSKQSNIQSDMDERKYVQGGMR